MDTEQWKRFSLEDFDQWVRLHEDDAYDILQMRIARANSHKRRRLEAQREKRLCKKCIMSLPLLPSYIKLPFSTALCKRGKSSFGHALFAQSCYLGCLS